MSKRKTKSSTLPPPLTGDEPLDLVWAGLTPYAEELLSLVKVVPVWATHECAMRFAAAVLRHDELAAELLYSPGGRLIARERRRRVEHLEWSLMVQTLHICTAVAAQVRSEYPSIAFGQVWTVVRDRVRALMRGAATAVLELPESERAEMVDTSALS